MTAEVFGGGMENEIRAKLKRSLKSHRASVIANASCSDFVTELCNGGKIDNLPERIRWRFGPNNFGICPKTFLDGVKIAHIDKINVEFPVDKDFAQQSRDAVISVHVCEHMIAGRKRLEDGHGCAGAGSKCSRRRAAFQRANSFLERLA